MAKVWTYTPNQYTTGMTFTVATSNGESPAVFTYKRINDTWAKESGNTSNINVKSTKSNVSITDSGIISSINVDWFNDTKHVQGPSVEVKKIVFLGPNDIAQYDNPGMGAEKVGKIYGLNDNMWYYFGEPSPITFTNLTEQIEFPALLNNYGSFYGYGILNCTADPLLGDYSSVQIDGNNVEGRAKCLWTLLYNTGTRIIKRDSTGEFYEGHGLDFLDNDATLANFSDNGVYYAIPLYYESAKNSIYGNGPDETKYGYVRDLASIKTELGTGESSEVLI